MLLTSSRRSFITFLHKTPESPCAQSLLVHTRSTTRRHHPITRLTPRSTVLRIDGLTFNCSLTPPPLFLLSFTTPTPILSPPAFSAMNLSPFYLTMILPSCSSTKTSLSYPSIMLVFSFYNWVLFDLFGWVLVCVYRDKPTLKTNSAVGLEFETKMRIVVVYFATERCDSTQTSFTGQLKE